MNAISYTPALSTDEGDDSGFLDAVGGYVGGAMEHTEARSSILVKVDNWFGPRWLEFANGTRSERSVWKREEVRIPRFAPNRVAAEAQWHRDADGRIVKQHMRRPLHAAQPNAPDSERRVADLTRGLALFWWSGGSKVNGRGCLMAYLPAGDLYSCWYIELRADRGWRPSTLQGLSASDADRYAWARST